MATRPVKAISRNAAGLSCTASAGRRDACALAADADAARNPSFGEAAFAYTSGKALLLKLTGVKCDLLALFIGNRTRNFRTQPWISKPAQRAPELWFLIYASGISRVSASGTISTLAGRCPAYSPST